MEIHVIAVAVEFQFIFSKTAADQSPHLAVLDHFGLIVSRKQFERHVNGVVEYQINFDGIQSFP